MRPDETLDRILELEENLALEKALGHDTIGIEEELEAWQAQLEHHDEAARDPNKVAAETKNQLDDLATLTYLDDGPTTEDGS